MAYHIAFVHKKFVEMFVNGQKNIESRLSINTPSCWSVEKDDVILFKEVGGEIRCAGKIAAVHKFDRLTYPDINVLASLFSRNVGVSEYDDYWIQKSKSRFAVFMEIEKIVEVQYPRHLTPRGIQSAWLSNFSIDQSFRVLFENL